MSFKISLKIPLQHTYSYIHLRSPHSAATVQTRYDRCKLKHFPGPAAFHFPHSHYFMDECLRIDVYSLSVLSSSLSALIHSRSSHIMHSSIRSSAASYDVCNITSSSPLKYRSKYCHVVFIEYSFTNVAIALDCSLL